jgi:hypothetical protein
MVFRVTHLVVLAVLLAGVRPARCDDSTLPATAMVGENAIIVVQVTRPQELINDAFDQRVKRLVQSLPPYQEAMAQRETQDALNLVEFFQNKYQIDLPTLLAKLVGGGLTLAVEPNDSSLLIVDALDAQILQEVHDFFRTIAQGEANKQGEPDRVKSAEYRGVTGWSFGPGVSHAIVGNRLLVANKPEVLKAALDRQAEPNSPSIRDAERYQAAVRGVPDTAHVKAFVDMSVFNQLPDFRRAMTQDDNPLTRLLFAPLQAALHDSTWLAAGVELSLTGLKVELVADRRAGAEGASYDFAVPAAEDAGAMPNLEVPRQIAGMSFYRDLHQFYAAKDQLFPQRTSGLIFFENMMGIFFSGRDLTQEVLAQTLPDLRVIVAEQAYDQKTGTPAMHLPGVAVVVRLQDPEPFSLVMKEAWQKAIGLVNFTRGQGALPGLIIDTVEHGGIRYTTSYFSVADEPNPEAADVRFNFQPSLATCGEHLIMSSSETLLKDLIDTLQSERENQTKPVPGLHSLVTLRAESLASILSANRETLVRQRMVDEGKSRDDAAQDISMLLTVLDYFRELRISAGTVANGSTMAIELGYELP